MATIQIRQNSPAWDPMRGQGRANFITDLQAVTQIIQQRLRLLAGEWFENLNAGLPLFQSILGVPSTSAGVGLIIQKNILGTPFVTGIQDLNITYGPSGRTYAFTATVLTQFGAVAIEFQPFPASQLSIS